MKQNWIGFHSWHNGGVNFVFCDGSVRFVSEKISPEVFEALTTIRGGEVIGDF